MYIKDRDLPVVFIVYWGKEFASSHCVLRLGKEFVIGLHLFTKVRVRNQVGFSFIVVSIGFTCVLLYVTMERLGWWLGLC